MYQDTYEGGLIDGALKLIEAEIDYTTRQLRESAATEQKLIKNHDAMVLDVLKRVLRQQDDRSVRIKRGMLQEVDKLLRMQLDKRNALYKRQSMLVQVYKTLLEVRRTPTQVIPDAVKQMVRNLLLGREVVVRGVELKTLLPEHFER